MTDDYISRETILDMDADQVGWLFADPVDRELARYRVGPPEWANPLPLDQVDAILARDVAPPMSYREAVGEVAGGVAESIGGAVKSIGAVLPNMNLLLIAVVAVAGAYVVSVGKKVIA